MNIALYVMLLEPSVMCMDLCMYFR
ncbi:hypothetical protein KIPB_016105, partial [Kipferlia bialata]|eukprot:g16105.t1